MSASTVPRLLMPGKVSGWAVTDMKGAEILGSDSVEGADCFKIEGSSWMGNKVTLWVDKRNYLIRKTFIQFIQHSSTVTTVYRPELDISLPDSAFESRVKK